MVSLKKTGPFLFITTVTAFATAFGTIGYRFGLSFPTQLLLSSPENFETVVAIGKTTQISQPDKTVSLTTASPTSAPPTATYTPINIPASPVPTELPTLTPTQVPTPTATPTLGPIYLPVLMLPDYSELAAKVEQQRQSCLTDTLEDLLKDFGTNQGWIIPRVNKYIGDCLEFDSQVSVLEDPKLELSFGDSLEATLILPMEVGSGTGKIELNKTTVSIAMDNYPKKNGELHGFEPLLNTTDALMKKTGSTYTLVKVNLLDPGISLFVSPRSYSGGTPDSFLANYIDDGLKLVINGGTVIKGTLIPNGFTVSNGDEWSDDFNSSRLSLIATKKGEYFFGPLKKGKAYQAITGQNSLIYNCNLQRITASDPDRDARTILALDKTETILTLGIVKGDDRSNTGLTISESAKLLKEFNACYAVNLDGGGSTRGVWYNGSTIKEFYTPLDCKTGADGVYRCSIRSVGNLLGVKYNP